MKEIKILLASNSPRRKQMIGWLGFSFRTKPADIDETAQEREQPTVYVSRLARQKAEKAHQYAFCGEYVLAADTVVVDGEDLLGKPSDSRDAYTMLSRLRGSIHTVYTAICLYDPHKKAYMSDLCTSRVPMREYTDVEIYSYIASGDPMDKAGAYAIQNSQFHPVRDFSDCYASVMGLPMCHLIRLLSGAVDEMKINPYELCRKHLDYTCPIYRDILHLPSGTR